MPTLPIHWLSSDWFVDADDVGYRFRLDMAVGAQVYEHISTGDRMRVRERTVEERVDDLERRVRALERVEPV